MLSFNNWILYYLRWGEQSWKSLVRILMTPTGTSTQCHTHSRANSCKCQWICSKSLNMTNGRYVLPSGWWCCSQEYKSDSSAPDLHLYPISTSYMQQPNVYRIINENQYILLFLTFGKTSHIGLNVSLNDLVSESKLKYEKLTNQTHVMHMHTFLTCSIGKPNIHNQNIDNSEKHGSQKSERKLM